MHAAMNTPSWLAPTPAMPCCLSHEASVLDGYKERAPPEDFRSQNHQNADHAWPRDNQDEAAASEATFTDEASPNQKDEERFPLRYA